MAHDKPYPLAGKTVVIKSGVFAGENYRIEDYWDRVSGYSWHYGGHNPACIDYALRASTEAALEDEASDEERGPAFHKYRNDEVLYGKLDSGLGKLIHVSQIEGPEGHG